MATSPDPTGPPGELVFVVGTGRCGSTLVHEVLARHSDVGFVSNLDDRLPFGSGSGRWNQALYRRLPPTLTKKGRLRYAPSEAYRLLDRRVSPMLSTPSRDLVAADVSPWLASELQGFFGARMAAQRKPVFLHKFTGWPRTGLLHGVFPDAKFIHVVRDGRAVVNSWLQMPWWSGYRGPEQWGLGPLSPADQQEYDASGRSFVVLAAIGWKILMRAYDEAAAALPAGAWVELRYEDIVADPAGEFDRMLGFSGLPSTDQFAAALRRYSFGAGRTEAFRHDLAPAALEALDLSLSSALEARGYH
jgi:Sulfotransferase family